MAGRRTENGTLRYREHALMVDAVTSWTPDFARAGPILATYGVGWLEDPFQRTDFEALRELCLGYQVPVCAGELCESAAEIGRLIDTRLLIVMLDVLWRSHRGHNWVEYAPRPRAPSKATAGKDTNHVD
jgi:hypothetical protein